MKRVKLILLSLLLLSCTFSASGCVYSNVRVPLDRDVDKTEFGVREGQASMQSMLWLFAWGDSSTRAAAEQGGLKTINHLDLEQLVVFFGLYTKTTTIAYGN